MSLMTDTESIRGVTGADVQGNTLAPVSSLNDSSNATDANPYRSVADRVWPITYYIMSMRSMHGFNQCTPTHRLYGNHKSEAV